MDNQGNNYTEEQKAIIAHRDGPAYVVAGAGKAVGGAGIGQLGIEFWGIERDVVRPGVEGAHPLALPWTQNR